MQTVFEVFDPVTGKTEGFKNREGVNTFLARMERAGYVRDYLPAREEGFYVLDMRGSVKAGPFAVRTAAERKREFENMCSDVNSFHVVEHRL